MCLTKDFLIYYRDHLREIGLQNHFAQNKLRDTDDKYADDGHLFSLNGEILGSYDVCAGCEAHALLLGFRHGISSNISTLPTLKDLPTKFKENNLDFKNCPPL